MTPTGRSQSSSCAHRSQRRRPGSDTVIFDPDDIDAAFAELDARYLAGEAAAHAHTWSVVTKAYAAVNRHELPPTTPDWVNIDHRRGGSAFAPGEMARDIRAAWDLTPDIGYRIEAVHRLNNVGSGRHPACRRGRQHEGFDAEWRVVSLLTVEGDLITRCEMFDEADLDAALANFDELSRAVASTGERGQPRGAAQGVFYSQRCGRYSAYRRGRPTDDRRKGLLACDRAQMRQVPKRVVAALGYRHARRRCVAIRAIAPCLSRGQVIATPMS